MTRSRFPAISGDVTTDYVIHTSLFRHENASLSMPPWIPTTRKIELKKIVLLVPQQRPTIHPPGIIRSTKKKQQQPLGPHFRPRQERRRSSEGEAKAWMCTHMHSVHPAPRPHRPIYGMYLPCAQSFQSLIILTSFFIAITEHLSLLFSCAIVCSSLPMHFVLTKIIAS